MMKKLFLAIGLSTVAAVSLCAQEVLPQPKRYFPEVERERTVVKAFYTDEAIKVDGDLSEQAWEKAEAYPLLMAKSGNRRFSPGYDQLCEAGSVKLLYDDKYLYIGAELIDSDVVADGKADQLHHYRSGDVLEIFLKPKGDTYYWELYSTPANFKSAFFITGRGSLFLPSFEEEPMDIITASKVDGTLNNWKDEDKKWTTEVAVPIAALEQYGAKFVSGAFHILLARYNFSRYLPAIENSSFPQMKVNSYHTTEEYGVLELVK